MYHHKNMAFDRHLPAQTRNNYYHSYHRRAQPYTYNVRRRLANHTHPKILSSF